jgi:hypothetical protein
MSADATRSSNKLEKKAMPRTSPKSPPKNFFQPRNTRNTRTGSIFAYFAYFAVPSEFYIGMVVELPYFRRFPSRFANVRRGFGKALNLRLAPQLALGRAVVSTAVFGVSPKTFGEKTGDPFGSVPPCRSRRRDADCGDRNGRALRSDQGQHHARALKPANDCLTAERPVHSRGFGNE